MDATNQLRKVVIYALSDPRDLKIRYIGQSCNLKSRLKTMMTPSSASSPGIKSWVADLRKDGLKPTVVILQETNQELAGELEQSWITCFKEAGANLLNQQFYQAPDYRKSKNWWSDNYFE